MLDGFYLDRMLRTIFPHGKTMILDRFPRNWHVFRWLGTWPESIWLGKKLKPGGYKAEKDAASDYQGLESVGRSYAE